MPGAQMPFAAPRARPGGAASLPGWAGLLVLALLAGCATRAPQSPADAVITGTALVRERIGLPPQAVFEAVLLDVSRADQPPVVLGRQRVQPAGSPPYAIRIPYAQAQFDPAGRHEVRARVWVDGRLALASELRHPVPPDRAYRHADVILRPMPTAPGRIAAAMPLLQTHWRLREVEGEPVAPAPAAGEPEPHLILQAEDGRVLGHGGCNRFIGDFAVQGRRLQVANLVSGLSLCLDRGGLESRWLRALLAVQSYVQEGTELQLRDGDGTVLLRFDAVEVGGAPPPAGAARTCYGALGPAPCEP